MRSIPMVLTMVFALTAGRTTAQEIARSDDKKPLEENGLDLGTGKKKAVPEGQGARPSKVGVVNIGHVFNKAKIVQQFREQFEKDLKPYKDTEERLRKRGLEVEQALRNKDIDPDEKEDNEAEIVKIKRSLEDLKKEYQSKVAKATENQLVLIYKRVNSVVARYARENGFTLILAYGEPADGEPFSFTNVTRHMEALDKGGITVMYFIESIDVSDAVLQILNSELVEEKGHGGATGKKTP